MTPNDRFAELWGDYLEGDLDAAGRAELLALLNGDKSLRAQAVDLFQLHRLLGFAHQDGAESGEAFVRSVAAQLPAGDEEFVETVMNRLPVPAIDRRRFVVRTIAALAFGLMVGVFVTSAAWVYATPRQPAPPGDVVLLDEGFESSPAPEPTGIPTHPHRWAGDFSELVGENQQVRPATGRRMFRFLRGDYQDKPNAVGSYVSDAYYLLDVRPYRAELDDGGALVQLSAGFNAASFPAHEKYQSSVSLYALDAETATNGSTRLDNTLQNDSLAFSRANRLLLDRQPETWQRLAGELRLPPGTDFVLVRIGVAHVTAAQRRSDFPGHYLDDVRMVLSRRTPMP
ncbi:MAG: hypothetical protein C0467_14860 [Planctomycetaceae bacterium]|nr:hypothetical protein [Planctomycetaceae bacterium]